MTRIWPPRGSYSKWIGEPNRRCTTADEMRAGLFWSCCARRRSRATRSSFREGVRVLSQALMEMEVEQHVVGAARHERTEVRSGHRNGYRQREWDTRVETVKLRVPRVRDWIATSLRFWSRAGGPRRRSRRSCKRPTYVHMGSRPAKGGRAGEGPRDGWHLKKPGLRALRAARRGGRALP